MAGTQVDKGDVQGWLVIVDPNNVYQAKQTVGYDRIQFTYMEDNFSESKSASYSSTAILGRSEPVRGYLGSSPRTLALQLRIPIEGDNIPSYIPKKQTTQVTSSLITEAGTQSTTATKDYVLTDPSIVDTFTRKLQVIDFIRSLVYPHYGSQTQQLLYPPPRVLVSLGSWFSMIGIVTSFNMTHKAPWAQGLMAPYFTDVSLSVDECDEPFSFQDILSGSLRNSGFDRSKVAPNGLSSRIG